MADNTVLATKYAREFKQNYEQKQSKLRGTVATEGVAEADKFVFIVAGKAEEAKERAANGLIPLAQDGQTSATCQLKEYHHKMRKTNFNIYASSVPQRMNMQRQGVTSQNQKTDQILLAQMQTTTLRPLGATGAAITLNKMLDWCSSLDDAEVPEEDRWGLLTPRAWAQMMKVEQFTNSRYVDDRPFMKSADIRFWNTVKWMKHTRLPSKGTNVAKCYIYHKDALGHGLLQQETDIVGGYNDEDDYSWSRATSRQGATLILTSGVSEYVHDDTVAI